MGETGLAPPDMSSMVGKGFSRDGWEGNSNAIHPDIESDTPLKICARLCVLFLLLSALAPAETFFPFRGDQGPLPEFRPQSALWLSEDMLLLGDVHRNNLHIFDTTGRRFRVFDAATNQGPAEFVGMSQLGEDDFLILGSHYHEKNHPRHRDLTSRLHRFYFNLEKEDLRLDDFKKNISPLESLRRTRMWGATPLRQLKFAGLGVDESKDIAWMGLTKPESVQGNLSLLRCSLSQLLSQDKSLEFTEVDTAFRVPIEESSRKEMYLTDLKVLDDGSLLLLLTADDLENNRLATNALYRWVPGGKTTLIKDDLGAEKRATAVAIRSLGGGSYRVALVCDNATKQTDIPSGLLILSEPLKIH